MFNFFWFVSLFSILIKLCNAYNILVMSPSPSLSHQQPFLALSRALAEKGHNVTIFTAHPGLNAPLKNYREIDISNTYGVWEKAWRNHKFGMQTKSTTFDTLHLTPYVTVNTLKYVYENKEFQEILKSNSSEVDLILYEQFHPGILGLVHHLNYPVTAMLTPIPKYIPVHSSMGNTVNPSYISSFVTSFSDKMTFFERLQNTFFVLYEIYIHNNVYSEHQVLAKEIFGPDIPSLKDLERNVNLMLLSGDLSDSYPMSLQPNTIQIGAIHIKEQKSLPEDIQKWMDESDEGVIYFSFGTNMKGTSVPEDKRNSFIKAFKQFPRYRFIWKWESDVDFSGKPENVLLKKWLPQESILAHQKVRLFIFQGGHQSHQEAIHYAVPMLTVPLFWDQEWNAKNIEVSGAGLTLNFDEITYETVYEKLKELLNNDSFKINAEKLSKISRDKPMSNIDTAVWWLEYVVRHKGATHMRPAVQNLYWFQYILLDVIAFVALLSFLILYLLNYFAKKLIRIKITVKKLKKQ